MSEYRLDIDRIAPLYSLDPNLVAAVVEQESGGNPWAWRPEARYRYFWNVNAGAPFRALSDKELALEVPPPDFPTLGGSRIQEWWAQQASWGLMQVMGAVARERGFTGTYLTRLCDPVANLTVGCQHLAHLYTYMRRQYKGLSSQLEAKVRLSVLGAWNGGIGGNRPQDVPLRNRDYALAVMERYNRIRSAPR